MTMTLEIAHRPAPAAPAPPRPNLSGLTRPELQAALVEAGVVEPAKARMRATQLWRWIHHHGVVDFAAMTDIAKELKPKLADAFTLARPEVVERQVSKDGTRKWLIRMAPGRSRSRPSTSPTWAARARSASPARSAAR